MCESNFSWSFAMRVCDKGLEARGEGVGNSRNFDFDFDFDADLSLKENPGMGRGMKGSEGTHNNGAQKTMFWLTRCIRGIYIPNPD